MRHVGIRLLATILLVFGAGTLDLRAQLSLEAVLEQMAAVGRELHSLETDVERTHVVVIVVDDHSISSGELYFEDKGDDSRIRMRFTRPVPQELLAAAGKAQIYNPRTNVVQEFDLGENPQIIQFFVLGFWPVCGGLDDALRSDAGRRRDGDGIATIILDPEPRSERVSDMFSSFRLWIDQARFVPLQVQLTAAGGDYNIVKYSNIQTNKRISGSTFDLNVRKNVQDNPSLGEID